MVVEGTPVRVERRFALRTTEKSVVFCIIKSPNYQTPKAWLTRCTTSKIKNNHNTYFTSKTRDLGGARSSRNQGTRSGVYTVHEHRSDEDDTEIRRSSQVEESGDGS